MENDFKLMLIAFAKLTQNFSEHYKHYLNEVHGLTGDALEKRWYETVPDIIYKGFPEGFVRHLEFLYDTALTEV